MSRARLYERKTPCEARRSTVNVPTVSRIMVSTLSTEPELPSEEVPETLEILIDAFDTKSIENALKTMNFDKLQHLMYPDSPILDLCFTCGGTIFHVACGLLGTDHEILHDLLRIGANINAQKANGFTPLHIALIKEISQFRDMKQRWGRLFESSVEFFANTKFLIQNGANLDIRNKYNNSPVDRAVRSGYLAAVEIFVNEETPVEVENRCLYVIKRLLNQQYYTLTPRRSLMLLKFSIINDDFPSFKYILNITKKGLTRRNKIKTYKSIGNLALWFATFKGTPVYIRVLMDEGFDPQAPNLKGRCAIYAALQDENIQNLKYLLACGLSVNYRFNWTDVNLLRYAVEKGSLETVKLLFNRGAKLETTNITTLHYAVLRNDPRIVKFLLEQGLCVNYCCDVSKYGTPLKLIVSKYGSSYLYNTVLNIFLDHVAKMIASKKYVSEENRKLLQNRSIVSIYEGYEKELTKMKDRNISLELNVSFLDILTKDIDYVGSLLKQADVILALNEAEYQCEFPIYSKDLKNRIKEAIFRRNLVELGNRVLSRYAKKNIPFEIALVIFKNLMINDLTNFVISR